MSNRWRIVLILSLGVGLALYSLYVGWLMATGELQGEIEDVLAVVGATLMVVGGWTILMIRAREWKSRLQKAGGVLGVALFVGVLLFMATVFGEYVDLILPPMFLIVLMSPFMFMARMSKWLLLAILCLAYFICGRVIGPSAYFGFVIAALAALAMPTYIGPYFREIFPKPVGNSR